ARTFPMLPERLSTDLTSLNEGEDRLATIVEMRFDRDAALTGSSIYRATVRNKAKLAYDAVSAWLESRGEAPAALQAVPGMDAQLRAQNDIAQKLRARRPDEGALEREPIQPNATFT